MSTAAIVKYQPALPVGKASTLKALLEQNKDAIAQLLPRHIKPERIIKTMLVAVNRNHDLLRCTQSSVFEAVMKSAELGLDLSGTLGEAYPVPYGQVCTLIIGYRGLAKLARNSGEVAQIEAEPVYSNDHFVYQKGTQPKLEFEPLLEGDRGTLKGFYALVRMKDGSMYTDFMSVAEVNKIKARSKASAKGPWVTDYAEMGRKTVFRRLVKWVPLSAEKFTEALEVDNTSLDLAPVMIEHDEPTGEALLDQLAKTKTEPEETEPEPPYDPPAEFVQSELEPEPEAAKDPGIGKDAADQVLETAKKQLGSYGARMVASFVKRTFNCAVEDLTLDQLDKVEAWVVETKENAKAQSHAEA